MSEKEMEHAFCVDLFKYERSKTVEVNVGAVGIGGDNPIRVQSMTTTNTLDTSASVEQIVRIIEAGGELVRLTTQGGREARNLAPIKKEIRARGYQTPLVADIHFNPNAADIAAREVEKVRINPGNFADGAKTFREKDYTNEEYESELENIRKQLVPFLNVCKENGTAIRIGTNHGSLSDRILSRYGDTPQGMVEACMEYLRICVAEDFLAIVLSIKASNTRIMVHTVRLLVASMHREQMFFPIHLGVTEAGDGEDGRIKSAVGCGALLVDGIGDTLRISLTEDPACEIPVARKLVDYVGSRRGHEEIVNVGSPSFSPFDYQKRLTYPVLNVGGDQVPVVVADVRGVSEVVFDSKRLPEFVVADMPFEVPDGVGQILPWQTIGETSGSSCFPLFDVDSFRSDIHFVGAKFLEMSVTEISDELLNILKHCCDVVILLRTNNANRTVDQRSFFLQLDQAGVKCPVLICNAYEEADLESFQVKASVDCGPLFLDGYGDGICLRNQGGVGLGSVIVTQFGILQASRVRFSKTEFISCPGCGRTLFNLQETNARIKAVTGHLKGLKIGIMGCIVNGPGEMADADYGYVGSGSGKISLYRKKEVVKKGLDEDCAVDELLELIKDDGLWVEA